MNNDITQISDSDLLQLLLNTTLQSELLKAQVSMIANEQFRRNQIKAEQEKQAAQKIVLPQLKKIQLPTLPPINNETK